MELEYDTKEDEFEVRIEPDELRLDEIVELAQGAHALQPLQMIDGDGQLEAQTAFKGERTSKRDFPFLSFILFSLSSDERDGRLSEQDRQDNERKMNDVLIEGDLDNIRNTITPNELAKCKTNTLEKSFEISSELKKLSMKKGPDGEELKSLATSVEKFTIQLIEPLKSDDMKRAIFGGDCFDRIIDEAVFFKQKKFLAHPVVYNILKKRWVGRFHGLHYGSWRNNGLYKGMKWIFLNIFAVFDVAIFPIVFLLLYCLHLLIGLLKNRQDMQVVFILNANGKNASKQYAKMQNVCSSVMDEIAVNEKVKFASISRKQKQHVFSEFKDLEEAKETVQTGPSDRLLINFTFMDCLEEAKQMLESVPGHSNKVLVIMTDTKSDANVFTTKSNTKSGDCKAESKVYDLIDDLKGLKARIVCVGFGTKPEIKELETMATDDESVLLCNNGIDLENIKNKIVKRVKGYDVFDKYTTYFGTPYFIFVRDMISCLVLLALHFAICLEPSTLHLIELEWFAMLFFVGRLMMEVNQVIGETNLNHFSKKEREQKRAKNTRIKASIVSGLKRGASRYFSDWWNIMDVGSLGIFIVLIIMRFITWAQCSSVSKNRLLAVTGYLYGLNTMFLTLRVFGQIMEFKRSTGSIQIALFQIIEAVIAIFGQFIAAILAFSLAITKIYIAEVSFDGRTGNSTHGLCENGQGGVTCWWASARFLTWSLMGIGDVAPLSSSDDTSDVIARVLYGVFLVIGVVMLMNMMIALLSNTYQQVEDNAFHEWSYRKAMTITTYRCYHCVPVPFNIISLTWLLARYIVKTTKSKYSCCKKTKRRRSLERLTDHNELNVMPSRNDEFFDYLVIDLQNHYFSSYGYKFPLEESTKLDKVLKETDGCHQLIGHIASRVFKYDWTEKQQLLSHHIPEWETKGIDVNGQRLSYKSFCECNDCWQLDERERPSSHGAKYLTPLSEQWPGFEVLIQESGERRFVAVGVVSKTFELHNFPGWEGNTAGYHIDDGRIFDRDNPKLGRECDDAMAYRGNLIGCRILYERENDGIVPVKFTLNYHVIGEGRVNIQRTSTDFYAFIGIGGEEISLMFRLCPAHHIERRPLDPRSPEVSSSQQDEIIRQMQQISTQLQVGFTNVSRRLEEIAERQSNLEHKVILLSGDQVIPECVPPAPPFKFPSIDEVVQ